MKDMDRLPPSITTGQTSWARLPANDFLNCDGGRIQSKCSAKHAEVGMEPGLVFVPSGGGGGVGFESKTLNPKTLMPNPAHYCLHVNILKFGDRFFPAGQWAQKVMHPSSGLTKEYAVTVDRPATRKHLQQVFLPPLPPVSLPGLSSLL